MPSLPPAELLEGTDLPSQYEDWAVKLCWLFVHCPLVDYPSIGEFFGQNNEDSIHCFGVFCAQFDYSGMDIDKALRYLLQSFLVPKESQQIDRVVKIFAHMYYVRNVGRGSARSLSNASAGGSEGADGASGSGAAKTNSLVSAFNGPDAAFTMCFSILLLNSDQHNKQVKKRMEKADFIRNNRGVNEGEDFDL